MRATVLIPCIFDLQEALCVKIKKNKIKLNKKLQWTHCVLGWLPSLWILSQTLLIRVSKLGTPSPSCEEMREDVPGCEKLFPKYRANFETAQRGFNERFQDFHAMQPLSVVLQGPSLWRCQWSTGGVAAGPVRSASSRKEETGRQTSPAHADWTHKHWHWHSQYCAKLYNW